MWLHAALASADAPPTPPETNTYEHWLDAGVNAYEAGRYAEARSLFRRAHDEVPTARTLRTIGMCSFNLGDYTDAVWNLESALGDERKPLTAEQQVQVRELITRAERHIGRFRVRLSPAQLSLIVDGRPALMLARSELLLEEGHHTLEGQATGYRAVSSVLNVEGGDRTTLVFELSPLPGAPAEAARAVAPAVSDERSRAVPVTSPAAVASADPTLSTLGLLSLGLGGASLVAFGVVGGLALAEGNSLHKHCPLQHCAPAYRDDVESYDRLRTASTITLVSAGAFAAVGLTLLLAAPRRDREEEPRRRAALEPWIGVGGLGVRGRL